MIIEEKSSSSRITMSNPAKRSIKADADAQDNPENLDFAETGDLEEAVVALGKNSMSVETLADSKGSNMPRAPKQKAKIATTTQLFRWHSTNEIILVWVAILLAIVGGAAMPFVSIFIGDAANSIGVSGDGQWQIYLDIAWKIAIVAAIQGVCSALLKNNFERNNHLRI